MRISILRHICYCREEAKAGFDALLSPPQLAHGGLLIFRQLASAVHSGRMSGRSRSAS